MSINTALIEHSRATAIAPILAERVRDYANASKAKRTQDAYKSAWTNFTQFCQAHFLEPMPATVETVISFITELAERGQRPSTIELKLAALSFAHKAAHAQDPTQSENVKIVMGGIRRKLGTAPTQKAPVMRDELAAMLAQIGADLRGKRDRALILLGWSGAFRRGELCALDVEDIQIKRDEMVITLRRSKTDQEGAGFIKRIPQIADQELDPVRAVRDWLDAASIKSGPLFRAIDRWGHVRSSRLTDKVVALVVKQAAKSAGLEPRQFAGHSLRSGFVTQAAKEDAPTWEIREVTGHKSDAMLQRYIRSQGLGQMRAIRRAFGEK